MTDEETRGLYNRLHQIKNKTNLKKTLIGHVNREIQPKQNIRERIQY